MKEKKFIFLIFVLASCMFETNIAQAENERPVTETRSLPSSVHPTMSHSDAVKPPLNESLQEQNLTELVSLLANQKDQIQKMQDKIHDLENSGGFNFAVWTGILLASVAVILTTLGIVMAIFSFFGYRKIMKSASEAATAISTIKASEVTERLAPEVTEKVLLKLIEKNKFDKIIHDAVEKVTYRGIAFSSEDIFEEKKEEVEK